MDLFDVLALVGGLSLFLFGMNLMGDSLEKAAGEGLKKLLSKLTTGKLAGFFTGLGVTAVIQSSSATTVMMVGFVNSGIMTLRQAINVIMGANVGTTVTSWLLSLTGIESSSLIVSLFKPTSFTPVLALAGIIMLMTAKKSRTKDIGTILLGFATLMFGMDAMSDAVSGLKNVPEFQNILIMFSNPILGVLAGAVLTGIIQSSSASVGILQALSSTGRVTIGTSIPIIMGQNIGTCVTALLSSVGTNRNARRASIVHLLFNVMGTTILLAAYMGLDAVFDFAFAEGAASELSIAVCHTAFNLLCTAIMLPMSGLLEKLSYAIIKEPKTTGDDKNVQLDERLMATPAIAIERARVVTNQMAGVSAHAIQTSLRMLSQYSKEDAEQIRTDESSADHFEDILGSYLVKLNTEPLSDRDSNENSKLLFVIGDLERISDYAVNILRAAEEIKDKGLKFTPQAQKDLETTVCAVSEIVNLTLEALSENNIEIAKKVEPLEQVIDSLTAELRASHIARLKKGECSIEAGFVWADIINALKRVSDHCSNIAGCIIEMSHESMDIHRYLNRIKKGSPEFEEMFASYSEKYTLGA